MKQTRQAVCAVKQSRFLDVYATDKLFLFTKQASQTRGQWYSDTSSFSIPCINEPIGLFILPRPLQRKKFYDIGFSSTAVRELVGKGRSVRFDSLQSFKAGSWFSP